MLPFWHHYDRVFKKIRFINKKLENRKMSLTQNNQRISARISPQVFEKLTQAAELSGATLNQFIVRSAWEKAQEIIEKERVIKMTSRSAKFFFEAIEHPPEPTRKLKKAVRQYKS
jgi:uncharacterized protein (DUF1778 family)